MDLIRKNQDLIKLGLVTTLINIVVTIVLGIVLGIILLILPILGLLLGIVFGIGAFVVSYAIAVNVVARGMTIDYKNAIIMAFVVQIVISLVAMIFEPLGTILNYLYPFFVVLAIHKDQIVK